MMNKYIFIFYNQNTKNIFIFTYNKNLYSEKRLFK